MDVIEQIGFDVSHRCYWDFGRWSDLCRVWRPAGHEYQLQEAVDFEVRCNQADKALISKQLSCRQHKLRVSRQSCFHIGTARPSCLHKKLRISGHILKCGFNITACLCSQLVIARTTDKTWLLEV